MVDTLILSDIHLGAEVSQARQAVAMLRQQRFQRLILLGDIFADLNFRRLKKEHWQFLSYIRKLSNPKRNIEVIWVEGNHDAGLTDVMSHLVGVKVYQEYTWEYAGLKHLAVHGHQFDGFVVGNLIFSHLLSAIHLQVQKIGFREQWVARLLDRANTRWLRLSAKVARGALALARVHGAQRVFSGHTHQALHRAEDGVSYYNSGCWTDSQLTYVTIGEEGVRIHEYTGEYTGGHHGDDTGTDDCDSSQERSEGDSTAVGVADEAGLLEDAGYTGVGR